MNKLIKHKEPKVNTKSPQLLGVVYYIRYGRHVDSGGIEKLAKNKAAIINLVKNDDYICAGKGVTSVTVDFENNRVYYDYLDWDDEIESGVLYLTKFEVIG